MTRARGESFAVSPKTFTFREARMRHIRSVMPGVGLGCIVLAASVSAQCMESDRPRTGTVAQEVKPEDSVGTNGSTFFPIGIWYEGSVYVPPGGPFGEENARGGPPVDAANDSYKYFEETLTQLKNWGINTVIHVNPDNAHGAVMLSAAESVGGIYVLHQPDAFRTADTCGTSLSDAQMATLAASVSSTFPSRVVPAFLLTDEPGANCMSTLRRLSASLNKSEQTTQPNMRRGFLALALHTESPNDYSAAPPYDFHTTLADRMLGFNAITQDDFYPFQPCDPYGEVSNLEDWGARFDAHLRAIPSDKQLWYVIQAHTWNSANSISCEPPVNPPNEAAQGLRWPSAPELRYETYSALARGAKGIIWFMYQRASDESGGRGGVVDYDYNDLKLGRKIQPRASRIRILAPWLADATRDGIQNSRIPIASAPSQTPNDYDLTSFQTTFGERLVMLVNEHATSIDPISVPRMFHVVVDKTLLPPKGNLTVIDVLTGASVSSTQTSATLEFDYMLDQGDGRLFLLQPEHSAEIRIRRDSYINPVYPGKDIKVTLDLKNIGSTTWTTSDHHVGLHVTPPSNSPFDILGFALPASIAPNASIAATLTIPTSTFSTAGGTYKFGVDLYEGTTNWFLNTQEFSVMVDPAPLLVDTFDAVPFNHQSDALSKWNPSEFAFILSNSLSVNGRGAMLSNWGSSWSDYTLEFDVMIDKEATPDGAFAGWMFHADGAASTLHGYMFQLAASDATATPNDLRKHKAFAGTFMFTGSASSGLAITRGIWYHIKQELTGTTSPALTTVKTYINGTLIDTMNDSTSPFRAGRVGFRLNEDVATCTSVPIASCGAFNEGAHSVH